MRIAALVFVATVAGAAVVPAAAQTPPALSYSQPLTPKAIELVQQSLRQKGVYSGRPDGVWGPESQAALERYQQGNGLQVTGQLNQATAASLGLAPDRLVGAGDAAAAATAVAPAAGSALGRDAIQAVQTRLRELNFYNGAVDGIWGGATQQAIERLQQGRGLQVNGQLNPATLAALGLDPSIAAPGR